MLLTSFRRGAAPCLVAFLALPLLSACGRLPLEGQSAAAGAAPPAVRFVDVARTAGLDYEWRISGERPLNILQTIGNGCALLDYDRDGNLDVLLVGPRLGLFRGDGRGRFTDTREAAGLHGFSGRFLGCAVGDFDGDRWPDLYVTGYRAGLLLRNVDGKRFEDVTRAAGLQPQPWGTSAAFAETVPGSGRLDLYVANYVEFGPETEPQLCREKGIATSCGPRYYRPLPGVLYRNEGSGRFTDVSAESGIRSVAGKGLGVAFADFDGSGRPGLAIANDEMPGDLLQPVPDARSARFKNIGVASGTAYDRDGNVHGGMGIDWGDYDNDGKFDLFVATFQNESKSLYRNAGSGQFSDMGIPCVIGHATIPFVAFGAKFFDYDNDGWLDVALANGHVQDNITEIIPTTTYRQASQLFRNNGGSPLAFEDVSAAAGPDFVKPIVGRGLAVGDLDSDGRVDLLIVDSEGRPLLLHNQSAGTGNWVGVALEGTRSNRHGYGAMLTLKSGGRTLVRQCQSGGSYLSASDWRVHFGLGKADRIDSLTIRWPSGGEQTYTDVPINRYLAAREGEAELQ